MIQRTALTTSALAVSAALILSGCTGDDAPASEEQTATETAAPGTEETEASGGDEQTAYGELIDGFPAAIEPLPEAEIVSSTLSPLDEQSPEGEDAGATEAPEGEDGAEDEDGAAGADGADGADAAADSERIGVSLVQLSEKSEEEILKFYTDSLKDKGFETVGDAAKEGDVTTQAFHDTKNDQTLSLTVGPGPDDEADNRQVTVGGVVLR
ncbi:hypothetical protein M3B11_13045 [Brevibacterium sp. p3-SID960]|uniref:hypothetical protein n=1 Tax=Brevibacterium sp. p3-SID960 TaxID=2916063 RepID=UPI0021A906A4|nr:hypothetical protein [Brevibacterium sp. p3-SID960]MCT1691861.1 hypothetical protein [Brevibacterium sp. p3-SID960]